MAKGEQERVGFFGRLKQIGMVFKFTAKQDKWFLPWVAAAVLIPLSLTVLAVALGLGWIWIPLGIMLTLLAVLVVLNVRANKVYMRLAEHQPGAAASIIEQMRGDWRVTPALASTTQLDMIHLVLNPRRAILPAEGDRQRPRALLPQEQRRLAQMRGDWRVPPALASTTQLDMIHLVLNRRGVILVAEGDRQRLRPMLKQEKRRLAKVIGSAPLYDFVLGHDEGEVPLRKLRMELMKLPKTLSGRDVNALDRRLKALATKPRMPRGAIPRDMLPRNLRPPKGVMRGR